MAFSTGSGKPPSVILGNLSSVMTPKVGATIYDKMNQPIYIPGTAKKIDTSKPLWFESNNKDTAEYAELIVKSAPKELGDTAVVAYGSLGSDYVVTNFGTKETPNIIDMVASSIEYYFTNKVFIEKKYKEALIDLLQYRAEVPAKQQTVDETAIPGTLWVAEQNGVKINLDDVKKEFAIQICMQIDKYAQEVRDYYKGSIKNANLYLKQFTDALKAYYIDPTPARMDTLVDIGVEIDKKSLAEAANKSAPIYLGWLILNMSVVAKLSTSLAAALSDRKNERTTATMAPGLDPVSRPEGLTPP